MENPAACTALGVVERFLIAVDHHGLPALALLMASTTAMALAAIVKAPALSETLRAWRRGGGPREAELEAEVAALRAENVQLAEKLRLLERRDDDMRHAVKLLADTLERQMLAAGQDVSLLATIRGLVAEPKQNFG